METIKRQIRVAYGCLVVGQSLCVQLSLQPVDCTHTLYVTPRKAPLQLWFAACCATYCKCYMPLPFFCFFLSAFTHNDGNACQYMRCGVLSKDVQFLLLSTLLSHSYFVLRLFVPLTLTVNEIFHR